MSRIGHVGRLLRDFVGFARENRAYWIVPLILTMLLIAGLVFAGQAASPFVYPLF